MRKGLFATFIVLLLQLILSAEDYHLQQSDILRMTIYQEEDMTTEVMIGKSGIVSFPLIGAVEVRGLTVSEAEEKLKTLYEKDYLVNAKVNVLVVDYGKKWITVSGAVENPGNVPYPEEGSVNVASAIAMAGGIKEDGNGNSITVAHQKGGTSKHSLATGGQIVLQPGDTVVVPRLPTPNEPVTRTAAVSGEVRNPGSITLPDNGRMDILTAVAQAGGFTRIANQRECILQRKTPTGHQAFTVNLRDISNGRAKMVFVHEDDIVIIRESRF